MNTRHSSYSLSSLHPNTLLLHSLTRSLNGHTYCSKKSSSINIAINNRRFFYSSAPKSFFFFTQLHLHSPFTHIPFSSAHSFNSFFLFTFNCCYPPYFSLFSSLLSLHIKKRSIGLNYKVSFSVLFSAIELRLTGWLIIPSFSLFSFAQKTTKENYFV